MNARRTGIRSFGAPSAAAALAVLTWVVAAAQPPPRVGEGPRFHSVTYARVTLASHAAATPSWAGYVVVAPSSSRVTGVAGGWTVPRVSCALPGHRSTEAAEWVGVDGYNTTTVQQAGTETACIKGRPTYYAWVEMFAANAKNAGTQRDLGVDAYPVQPGDSMYATVTAPIGGDGRWQLAITNLTEGWAYRAALRASEKVAEHTAEWIVERPTMPGGASKQVPLSHIGVVGFSDADYSLVTRSVSLSATESALALKMSIGGADREAPTDTDDNSNGFRVIPGR